MLCLSGLRKRGGGEVSVEAVMKGRERDVVLYICGLGRMEGLRCIRGEFVATWPSSRPE